MFTLTKKMNNPQGEWVDIEIQSDSADDLVKSINYSFTSGHTTLTLVFHADFKQHVDKISDAVKWDVWENVIKDQDKLTIKFIAHDRKAVDNILPILEQAGLICSMLRDAMDSVTKSVWVVLDEQESTPVVDRPRRSALRVFSHFKPPRRVLPTIHEAACETERPCGSQI